MNFTISKDSTLRALRTLYQGFVALAVVAPILVTVAPVGTPLAAAAASMVAAVALVSKALNALEAAGIKLPFYPPAVPAAPVEPAGPAVGVRGGVCPQDGGLLVGDELTCLGPHSTDPTLPPIEDIDPTQPPTTPTIDPAP